MTRLAALALLTMAQPACAQAWQCHAPRSIESPPLPRSDGPRRVLPIRGYTLALSWSPEYCRAHRADPASATQCNGRLGRFGFILHGLWPEAAPGQWPQWCAPRPVPAETLRQSLCLTPSPALLVHEWAKHGSCMARSPEGYFRAGRALMRSLTFPDMAQLSRIEGLNAGALRKALRDTTPFLPVSAIRVKANPRGWLQEVQLCYGKDFMPASCAEAGMPDSAPLKIWRSF